MVVEGKFPERLEDKLQVEEGMKMVDRSVVQEGMVMMKMEVGMNRMRVVVDMEKNIVKNKEGKRVVDGKELN